MYYTTVEYRKFTRTIYKDICIYRYGKYREKKYTKNNMQRSITGIYRKILNNMEKNTVNIRNNREKIGNMRNIYQEYIFINIFLLKFDSL